MVDLEAGNLTMAAMAVGISKPSLSVGMGSDDKKDVEGEESDKFITAANQNLVALGAVGGVASAVGTFFLGPSAFFIDSAAVVLLGVAPLVVYQKVQLGKLGSLRNQHNHLRESVNTIKLENDKLTQSVDELEKNVADLKDVEGELDRIAKASGGQVDRLVAVVKENGRLQQIINQRLEAQVVQQLVTAIIQADRDHDFTIGPTEVEILVLRLKNLQGIVFNEAKFRDFVHSDEGELTIKEVMEVTKNLEDQDPAHDHIFKFKPKDFLQ